MKAYAYKFYKNINRSYSYLLYSYVSYYARVINRQIPRVLTIDETIDKVVSDKCSVSRYGDGEMMLISGKSITFQDYTPELGKRLSDILKSDNERHLVCLPSIFQSLDEYKELTKNFWKRHLGKYMMAWLNKVSSNKVYYNSSLTRPYYSFKDYDKSRTWFVKLKQIWQDKDIVFIEGYKSRLGVGNDLFDNARSVERILCPSNNAFGKYEEIMKEAKKIDKSKLVLIALGPTATVLAFDLHQLGYQALDIGHVDIEYEWFLMRASKKVNIAHKHTNEAVGNNAPDAISDKKYNSEVVASLQ